MKNSPQIIGFLYALSSALIYGLYPVFAHYFSITMDPLLFAGTSNFIGSIPLLIYLKNKKRLSDTYSKKFRTSILQISLLVTVATILFFIGTSLTNGINTGLLLQIEPFYAIVISAFFLHEIITKNQFLATSTLVLGAGVLIFKQGFGPNLGDFLIILTPLLYQFSHVIAKKILSSLSDPIVLSASGLFFSGIFITFLALLSNPISVRQLTHPQNVVAITLFGLILRSLEVSLWYQAIKRIKLSVASALIPLSAGVSFLGAIIILGEKPAGQQYLGLIFILMGLIWLSALEIKDTK